MYLADSIWGTFGVQIRTLIDCGLVIEAEPRIKLPEKESANPWRPLSTPCHCPSEPNFGHVNIEARRI
jgi:hypothetical protein